MTQQHATLDDFTPAEVWREYEARKHQLTQRGLSDSWQYMRELECIENALGLGIPPQQLTRAQRAEQARAQLRWKGRGCDR